MPDRPSQDGLFLEKNGQAGHHWYTGDQPDNMSGAGVILSLFNSRWRNYLILLDFFACTILFDVLSTVYSVSINIQLNSIQPTDDDYDNLIRLSSKRVKYLYMIHVQIAY